MVMVTQVQKDKKLWSLLGNIIKETKMLMAKFPCYSIQHVGRLGNEVAYRLARHACNLEDVAIWWNSYPDFVYHNV